MSDWTEELADRLGTLPGPVEIGTPRLLAGGASKEAWAVDLTSEGASLPLLVRRAGRSVMHADTLSLEHEYRVIEVAYEAGVSVPKPYRYLHELGGREAFALERVEGETIGRRIVRNPELADARRALPTQLAVELARVHALERTLLPFLPEQDVLDVLEAELDSVGEPHPAIELGLRWLRDNRPEPLAAVVCHGDFRIGNIVVSTRGLEYVLDWEFAHLGDPREDLAWPLVRNWRFGADGERLGGVGDVEPYLECYVELTGRPIAIGDLFWWEVLGNARWATTSLTQSRRHLRGRDRSVELAVLGRLTAEVEYELLDLLGRAS